MLGTPADILRTFKTMSTDWPEQPGPARMEQMKCFLRCDIIWQDEYFSENMKSEICSEKLKYLYYTFTKDLKILHIRDRCFHCYNVVRQTKEKTPDTKTDILLHMWKEGRVRPWRAFVVRFGSDIEEKNIFYGGLDIHRVQVFHHKLNQLGIIVYQSFWLGSCRVGYFLWWKVNMEYVIICMCLDFGQQSVFIIFFSCFTCVGGLGTMAAAAMCTGLGAPAEKKCYGFAYLQTLSIEPPFQIFRWCQKPKVAGNQISFHLKYSFIYFHPLSSILAFSSISSSIL